MTVPMYVYICMHVKWSSCWEWLNFLCWVLLQNALVATWSMCAVEKYSSLARREERQRERDRVKEREREKGMRYGEEE